MALSAYFGAQGQMLEWIRRLQQEHPVEYFGVNMAYGSLSHDQVRRSMELTKRAMAKLWQRAQTVGVSVSFPPEYLAVVRG